jgi:hypothetical protein
MQGGKNRIAERNNSKPVFLTLSLAGNLENPSMGPNKKRDRFSWPSALAIIRERFVLSQV